MVYIEQCETSISKMKIFVWSNSDNLLPLSYAYEYFFVLVNDFKGIKEVFQRWCRDIVIKIHNFCIKIHFYHLKLLTFGEK